jgi:tetratricopeptide (TPR) repeat protein
MVLGLVLGLWCAPAAASPTSDVQDAEVLLQQGDATGALRLLRPAMRVPDKVKDRVRALGFTLLGEALLTEATAAIGRGEPTRAARDRLLEAMAAGYGAVGVADAEAELVARARAVVDAARSQLFEQALDQVHGDSPGGVRGWFDGLEAVEGETLESLALRAMHLAATGKHAQALTAFEAATSTADQPGTRIRTPRWGQTYLDQARSLVADKPDDSAISAAIVVLERGLAWQTRATTDLDKRHDFALRAVRRALESERLSLLMRLPDRRTETAYAMEAILADNVGNVGLLVELGPWLEQHYPNRALEAYQSAQQATPNDPRLPRLAGTLLATQATQTAAELRAARDTQTRQTLRLRLDGLLRDALAQLERAHELDPENSEVVWQLVGVCRERNDKAAAAEWRAKAEALADR